MQQFAENRHMNTVAFKAQSYLVMDHKPFFLHLPSHPQLDNGSLFPNYFIQSLSETVADTK